MNLTDITLAVELHATGFEADHPPRLWGRKLHQLYEGNHNFDLIPTLMPADRYDVSMTPLWEAPEAGWVTTKVGLAVNASHLGFRPAAFYLGHPSDWASGIVRFAQPFDQAGPHRQWRGFDPRERPVQVQGPVFTLTFRRDT